MDWKELLGEGESFTVEDIEKATAGMKVVDISGGGYIPREKYNARVQKLEAERDTLKAERDELKAAGDGDEGLKRQIAQLEADLAKKDAAIAEASKSAEEAKAEANRASRERAVLKRGIDPKVADFVLYKAEQMVSDEVEFDTALDKYLADNPEYATAPSKDMVSGKPTKGRPENEDSRNEAHLRSVMGLAETQKE